MGNKQSGPIPVTVPVTEPVTEAVAKPAPLYRFPPRPFPEPPVYTSQAENYIGEANPNLPIFKVRTINPSGDFAFWKDISERYPPMRRTLTGANVDRAGNILEFGFKVFLKLRLYPSFIHLIVDTFQFDTYMPDDIQVEDAIKILKDIATKPPQKGVGQEQQVIQILRAIPFEEANIHVVNSNTKEGLEAGSIDNYLSEYGNAMILSHGHVTVIRKIKGNYIFIDPHGEVEESPIAEMISYSLPFKKQLQQSQCVLQGTRGVCFLYAIFFMCYPDLSPSQLKQIVEAIFQRTRDLLEKNYRETHDFNIQEELGKYGYSKSIINENTKYDLYILAVMEDFLSSDPQEILSLPPEQRLQKRKTAGRRKKSKKTRRKK